MILLANALIYQSIYSMCIHHSYLYPNNGILQDNNGDDIADDPDDPPEIGTDFTYVPNPDYFGLDEMLYKCCDNEGLCSDERQILFVIGDENEQQQGEQANCQHDEKQRLRHLGFGRGQCDRRHLGHPRSLQEIQQEDDDHGSCRDGNRLDLRVADVGLQ